MNSHAPNGFGAYIRELRESYHARMGTRGARRMTQQELADAVGVSKGYISQIENDRMPPTDAPPRVSDDVLVRLAQALAVTEEEMFRHSWRSPAGYELVRKGSDEETGPESPGDALTHGERGTLTEDLIRAGYPELDADDRAEILEIIELKRRRARREAQAA